MSPDDWEAVRAIYREGIATRNATFETDAPGWDAWDRGRLRAGRLVARAEGRVVGWAALSPVSARPVYAGVAEASLYVDGNGPRAGRRVGPHAGSNRGVGTAGVWTLQGAIFPENTASLALVKRFGFREVGVREKIGRMDGVWRDTILVECRSRSVGPVEGG